MDKAMDRAMQVALWAAMTLVLLNLAALGGVYYPNTLAGAVARFVFSLHA